MDAALSPDLIAAYRGTRYGAGDADAYATVGERSPSVDALLEAHGALSGVFITAWNPGSAPQELAANRAAHARLATDIAGWRHLAHVGVGTGGWREEGVFVLDLPEVTAIEIARRHGQVAIVAVRCGEDARLILTGVPPAGRALG